MSSVKLKKIFSFFILTANTEAKLMKKIFFNYFFDVFLIIFFKKIQKKQINILKL